MRANTSVTWTSGSGTVKADKSTGCLTISKTDDTQYTYGTNIYIVGVIPSEGISKQITVPVGMERALDKVNFEGFINIDKKPDKVADILTTLPKDFAKGKYRLLFTAYDQDGNEMEATKEFTDKASPKVTFIGDNPMLVSSEFGQGDIYTIESKKFCSVTVEPGMYVDKGGEVNITAISNTTGNKTTKNYVIGAGAVLKSLELIVPTGIVADGDQDVNISYLAKDTEGKEVTNYETITRSTNQLKLSSTAGTLKVCQTENGTAEIKWSDSVSASDFAKGTSSAYDGVERPVSLMATVIGGENSSILMQVSDTRRPVAVSSVQLNGDNNNMITESNTAKIDFFGWAVKYIDQYGEVLDDWKAQAFFEATNGEGGFDGHEYGVKADVSSISNIQKNALNNNIVNYSEVKVASDSAVKWVATNTGADADHINVIGSGTPSKDNNGRIVYDDIKSIVLQNKENLKTLSINTDKIDDVDGKTPNAVSESIKYSVVRLEEDASKNKEWNTVDAENNIDYTIVPVERLGNLRIKDIGKLRVITKYSGYDNGSILDDNKELSTVITKDSTIPADNKRNVEVAGTYDGKTITVSRKLYTVTGKDKTGKDVNSVFDVNNTTGEINGLLKNEDEKTAIKYSDLYDANTVKNARKDTKREVSALVYDTEKEYMYTDSENKEPQKRERTELETVSTNVTISDALRSPVKIEFISNNAVANNYTLRAANTNLNFDHRIARLMNSGDSWGKLGVMVTDQYGDVIEIQDPRVDDKTDEYGNPITVDVKFSVSNPVENTGEFAHLTNSLLPSKNNSTTAYIDGAEINDKFDLTATIDGTDISTKVAIKIGADECAYISGGTVIEDEPAFEYVYGKYNEDEKEKTGWHKKYQLDKNDKQLTLRNTLGYDR